jgi:hypothetical protein
VKSNPHKLDPQQLIVFLEEAPAGLPSAHQSIANSLRELARLNQVARDVDGEAVRAAAALHTAVLENDNAGADKALGELQHARGRQAAVKQAIDEATNAPGDALEKIGIAANAAALYGPIIAAVAKRFIDLPADLRREIVAKTPNVAWLG